MKKIAYLDLKQYQVLNKIGSGTLSDVYKIRDKKSNLLYEAKIISKAIDLNTKVFNDFWLNFTIISKIIHPSIHKMIAFSPVDFQKENNPVIISEFMGNGTLKEIIEIDRTSKRTPILTDTRKLIIIYGIASAMFNLHSYGITHQDLKPSNILINDYLCPQITDIALTKYFHPDPQSKNKPIYTSPEICAKSEYSLAGDVYSFGLIVFELISNEEPFKKISPDALSEKIAQGVRPKFNTKIPDAYKKLIESCWLQDSFSRPTFERIIEDLKSNNGYITENVIKEDYLDYIKYIDEFKLLCEKNKRRVEIVEFIKRKTATFEKIEINQDQYNIEPMPDERALKEMNELYSKAAKHYNGKGDVPIDKPLAFQYFQKAADKGHAESMYYAAYMLQNGDGIPQNIEEAAKYYKKAADKGNVNAMNKYALILLKGEGVKSNKEEAAKYFQQAADKGNASAMNSLASMLYKGDGIKADKKAAALYYKNAAEKGNLNSMYKYSQMLFNGDGVAEDKKEASKYCKNAADLGSINAITFYASMLRHGNGVPVNKTEAVEYYKIGITKGSTRSMHEYAMMLYEADGIPMNKKEAIKYFKKAADKGDVESMFNYGKELYKGDEIPMNKKEAAAYFKNAADKGEPYSMNQYAKMLLGGDGIEANKKEAEKYFKKAIGKDFVEAMYNYAMMKYYEKNADSKKEAAKYFQMAADKGNKHAMTNYALMLSTADGIQCDKKKAEKYYKMAIKEGNEKAMYCYAVMLLNWDSVQQHKEKASEYFKRAADKGHLNSMHCYAVMLFRGDGVKKDKKKAIEYFKKAADEGHLNAMFEYGMILLKGDGISINKKEASKYFERSSKQGQIESTFNYGMMLMKGEGIEKNESKSIEYLKKSANAGDIDSIFSLYLICKKGYGKNSKEEESTKYFERGIKELYKDTKSTEEISNLYKKEKKDRIKLELKNCEGIQFDLNNVTEFFENIPYKQKIGGSPSVSIYSGSPKLVVGNTEVVCNDGMTTDYIPKEVFDEIAKFQSLYENEGFDGKVQIQYISESDGDCELSCNEYDIDVNENKNYNPDDIIDPVLEDPPPPSKIVECNPSKSQIYLLIHDRPRIPDETKAEDLMQFTENESDAEAIANFNNTILNLSKYREEMLKYQNDDDDELKLDSIDFFKSNKKTSKA